MSGLNRGLVASEEDLRNADSAAKEIEAAGGPVDLAADLEKLQGRWKLIYSSAFSSKTLGGSRPGPPTRRLLPITLGQVSLLQLSVLVNSINVMALNALSFSKKACFNLELILSTRAPCDVNR